MLTWNPRSAFSRGAIAVAVVLAASCGTWAVCKQQVGKSCAEFYLQPSDGCQDTVTNISQGHTLIVPASEVQVAGWDSQQPELCLVEIQRMVRENPDDPSSACVEDGAPFFAYMSGLIGAGTSCTTND